MKKYLVLFVVLALAMSAVVLSAAAQSDLPAIDEAAAADLLGRWYMNEICTQESCYNIADLGLTFTYDVNPDNTIIINADSESPSANLWYMEDGIAYSVVEIAENKTSTCAMVIDENGMLVVAADDGYVTYTRGESSTAVSEEVIADAGLENYKGEWHMKGVIYEDQLIGASLLGVDFVLTIGSETFKLSDGLAEDEAEFILEEGKLYSILEGVDENGAAWEDDILIEYHDDDSLFFYFNPGTADESVWVFTREKNVIEPSDIASLVGTDENSEGGMDLGGLLEGLLSGEGGSFDVSGLIQQVTGSEGFDLNGLISGLTSGEGAGGFDFGGLLDGLTTGGAEGEGGFDLGGLLDLFGSGF